MQSTAAGDSHLQSIMLGSDPEGWVLHDVFEEHLEELEFLRSALPPGSRPTAPYLRVLEDGIESRLNAHLDALELAGPEASPEAHCAAPRGARPERCRTRERSRPGVWRGLDGGRHRPLLRTRAAGGPSGGGRRRQSGRGALRSMRLRGRKQPSRVPHRRRVDGWSYIGLRGLPPANLFPSLISTSEDLLASALLALRGREAPAFVSRLEDLAEVPTKSVRERALSLALAWGGTRGVEPLRAPGSRCRAGVPFLDAGLRDAGRAARASAAPRIPSTEDASPPCAARSGNVWEFGRRGAAPRSPRIQGCHRGKSRGSQYSGHHRVGSLETKSSSRPSSRQI